MRIFVTVICLLLLCSFGLSAHTPSDVMANFDLDNHILTVEIVHKVGEASKTHFVEEVEISHNGKKVIEQTASRQLSDNQTFRYFMPGVESGDKIFIEAYCSIQGEQTFELTVEEK